MKSKEAGTVYVSTTFYLRSHPKEAGTVCVSTTFYLRSHPCRAINNMTKKSVVCTRQISPEQLKGSSRYSAVCSFIKTCRDIPIFVKIGQYYRVFYIKTCNDGFLIAELTG
jgi:hypothetical protein